MPETASLTLISPGLFRHPQKVQKQKCCKASSSCQVDTLSAQRLIWPPAPSHPSPLPLTDSKAPTFPASQAHPPAWTHFQHHGWRGLGFYFGFFFLFGSERKSKSAFSCVSSAALGRRAQLVWSDLALVIICYFSNKTTHFHSGLTNSNSLLSVFLPALQCHSR